MKKRAMDKVLNLRRLRTEEAMRLADQKRSRAFGIEEIKSAHSDYVNAAFDAMRANEGNEKTDAALHAYRNALKKYGYSESDFEYKPVCPLCRDTGSRDGKLCDCVKTEYISALKEICDIESRAPFTFDDCDLTAISDAKQREELKITYDRMREYTEKFPNVSRLIILLSGSVGTGKTCVASAMARAAVEKGCSVEFLSAYEFNALMLRAHTSPVSERNSIMHDALNADFLVIDDLGTEPTYRNVTVEYLLLTLEERLNKRLVTIITSNLGVNQISARYGERIYSRLSDKLHSLSIELKGKDLRI